MIRAVIFDLDGTIGNTIPLCIAAFRKAVEPLANRHLTDEEIIATFGPSEEGTIQALIPRYYTEALSNYLMYYEELHDMTPRPFDGIIELLRWLSRKNIIIALVTDKGEKSCETTLSKYEITNYFKMIETGSPYGQRKAEGIKAVLDEFHLFPKSVVYIGDSASDILSAREAQVTVVSAAWGNTADIDELQSLKPDELFTSVDELRGYLENNID